MSEGWIPSYYCGRQQMEGPVCPECCKKHLRIGKDGEWETIAPPADDTAGTSGNGLNSRYNRPRLGGFCGGGRHFASEESLTSEAS